MKYYNQNQLTFPSFKYYTVKAILGWILSIQKYNYQKFSSS